MSPSRNGQVAHATWPSKSLNACRIRVETGMRLLRRNPRMTIGKFSTPQAHRRFCWYTLAMVRRHVAEAAMSIETVTYMGTTR